MYFNKEIKLIKNKKTKEKKFVNVCKFRGLIAIHRTFFQKKKKIVKQQKIQENI